MKTKVKDDKRLSQKDLRKVDGVVEEAMQWLDINKLAEIKVIGDKKRELESVYNSIVDQFM